MASLALRDECKVFLFLPGARSSASMDLELDGSYLCVTMTGDAELERDDERQALSAGKLYLASAGGRAPPAAGFPIGDCFGRGRLYFATLVRVMSARAQL